MLRPQLKAALTRLSTLTQRRDPRKSADPSSVRLNHILPFKTQQTVAPSQDPNSTHDTRHTDAGTKP